MKKNVSLLWTGGWDSTYRLVELSQKEVIIQPVYILNPDRKSKELEMDAMQRIREALLKHDKTVAEILPIRIIAKNELPVIPQITQAYKNLNSISRLGTQYEYLARAATLFPGIEIGIEKPNGEFSGCYAVIEKTGKLINNEDTYVLCRECSSEDCRLLFENFSFPICNYTEVQMAENIQKMGYINIMKMIHFCHEPIFGKPCGYCRPCEQKMECEMKSLLPLVARYRYYILCSKGTIVFPKLLKKAVRFEGRASRWLSRRLKNQKSTG